MQEDRSLRSSVDAAIADFVPWLEDSKLPFFPDYTDHGTKHVEGILVTASSLIGDEAWEAVTAQDVGVLILSALLHDCAMHITEDGFHALVGGRTHTARVPGFGDADWPALWQDYLFSAKRFDDRTLTDLFGEPLPVRTPPSDINQMTRADRVLIGEFVRRHHPRLAHEIARHGVPGPDDRRIKLSERLDPELADLAGLVARSHGLPLRATFDYLKKYYHPRAYKGVRAIFLMAVLRVADYMQIQAERAPSQMLKVKRIRSPFSRREWRAHLSVSNVGPYEDDPEAILVQAKPPDVRTFLRLKGWLAGIQEELDTSWAVLGEVYGPRPELRPLGLVIRRVRSNLDDARSFAELVTYVPRRVEFDIARGEILKLLVRPLYGDRPEIGIRELLQNSLDAVRELWDLQEQNPRYRTADLIEQEADVVMWLDEPDEAGRATFTISDRGVGMTEEVITDYFLKVGASYRNSDAWAKQHEGAGAGEDGEPSLKSRVLRSGRFGIGALAAFLLGDEIEVTTRHAAADEGIRFTTRLDSEPIELRRVEGLKVGTTVRVVLSRERYRELAGALENISGMSAEERERALTMRDDWDWYCLSSPSALRRLGRDRVTLPQRLRLPGLRSDLPPGWFEVRVAGYEAVHCSLQFEVGLACNGIVISDLEEGSEYSITKDEENYAPTVVAINEPFVSVFDPDGNLPLNLTRSQLTEDGELVKEVSRARLEYFLAHLLVHAPTGYEFIGQKGEELCSRRNYRSPRQLIRPLFYTADGVSIAEPWNILNAGVAAALVLAYEASPLAPLLARPDNYDATFLLDLNRPFGRWAATGLASVLAEGFNGVLTRRYRLPKGDIGAVRVLTSHQMELEIRKSRRSEWSRLPPDLKEEWSDGRWVLLTKGNPPPPLFDVESLPEAVGRFANPRELPIAAEWFLDREEVSELSVKQSQLARLWETIIREPVIPYDLQERREKLAHAYRALAPYVEKIEGDARAAAAAKKKAPRKSRRGRRK
ncbi:MAG TPA: hypothetical protein VN228_13885 [Pyrinomonadaceae bacterium]|nr:hypothetical protein [Pyrinomonadaceae bacterium]